MEQTIVNNQKEPETLLNQNMISSMNINQMNNTQQINQPQQQASQQIQQLQATQNINMTELDPNDYMQILKIFEKYNLKVILKINKKKIIKNCYVFFSNI
jgi:hypothetical protein